MLGTPAFAVPTFEALLASRHEVVGLVCQPDRPKGRGQHVVPPPTKVVAQAHGVPVFQPLKLKDDALMAAISALGAEVGVVAAYGRILPDAFIALPPRGMINVHASLLPRHRGAAPVHRAVMAGDAVTGVTIMRVVKALDAGAMMAVVETPIGPDETSVEVEQRLATLGADLLMDVVHRLAQGPVDEIPQDDQAATYAPKITREDGPLDWTRPAQALHDQVRGLYPWPHASTTLEGQRLIVHRSRVGGPATEPVAPGTVVAAARGTLAVACGDGRTLDLLVIQPEGRRAMAAAEFLAGHRVVPGVRLGR